MKINDYIPQLAIRGRVTKGEHLNILYDGLLQRCAWEHWSKRPYTLKVSISLRDRYDLIWYRTSDVADWKRRTWTCKRGWLSTTSQSPYSSWKDVKRWTAYWFDLTSS